MRNIGKNYATNCLHRMMYEIRHMHAMLVYGPGGLGPCSGTNAAHLYFGQMAVLLMSVYKGDDVAVILFSICVTVEIPLRYRMEGRS